MPRTAVGVGGCHGDEAAAADRNSFPRRPSSLESLEV